MSRRNTRLVSQSSKEEGRIFGLGDDRIMMRALLCSLENRKSIPYSSRDSIDNSNGFRKLKVHMVETFKKTIPSNGETEDMYNQNTVKVNTLNFT